MGIFGRCVLESATVTIAIAVAIAVIRAVFVVDVHDLVEHTHQDVQCNNNKDSSEYAPKDKSGDAPIATVGGEGSDCWLSCRARGHCAYEQAAEFFFFFLLLPCFRQKGRSQFPSCPE